MRVVATMVGYDGLAVRSVGEVFDMPHGESTWFKPVEPVEVEPVVVATEVSEDVPADPVPEQHAPRRGRPPKSK